MQPVLVIELGMWVVITCACVLSGQSLKIGALLFLFRASCCYFLCFLQPNACKNCPKSDLSTEGGRPPLAGPPWGKFCGIWVEENYEILPADRTVGTKPGTKGG